MPNIFPTFKTLMGLGSKVGVVPFFKWVGSSGNANIPLLSSRIDAVFSRPDIGASSGSFVFGADGKLTELSENQPDWSFINGCPRIVLRPQAQNLIGGDTPSYAGLTANGTIENPYGIDLYRFTTLGGVQCQARFSAAQIGTLTNGTPYLLKWYVYVGSSDNSDRFRIESIGTVGTGFGATTWQYNGTTTPGSAAITDMGFDDLGGGYYQLSCIYTPTADESGLIIDFQVQNGVNDPGAGDDIAWGGFQLIPDGFVNEDILNASVRSSNQVWLSDLITEGAIGSSGEFSIRIKANNYSAGGTSGDNAILFKDVSDTNILALWGLSNGFTPYDMVGTAYVDNAIQRTDLIITFDGQNLKMYDNTGEVASYSFAAGHLITQIQITPGDNYFELEAGDVSIEPLVISEAEAIAILS